MSEYSYGDRFSSEEPWNITNFFDEDTSGSPYLRHFAVAYAVPAKVSAGRSLRNEGGSTASTRNHREPHMIEVFGLLLEGSIEAFI